MVFECELQRISISAILHLHTPFSLNLHHLSNSHPQLPLRNRIHKLTHILPALIQHKLKRLHPRLTVIRKPVILVTQTAHIVLDHTFQRRILLEIQNLRRIQLEVILDNVVVRNIVAPALSTDLVRGTQRVLCCCETRRVRIRVVEMSGKWV